MTSQPDAFCQSPIRQAAAATIRPTQAWRSRRGDSHATTSAQVR
jgi:hypothetical protein